MLSRGVQQCLEMPMDNFLPLESIWDLFCLKTWGLERCHLEVSPREKGCDTAGRGTLLHHPVWDKGSSGFSLWPSLLICSKTKSLCPVLSLLAGGSCRGNAVNPSAASLQCSVTGLTFSWPRQRPSKEVLHESTTLSQGPTCLATPTWGVVF